MTNIIKTVKLKLFVIVRLIFNILSFILLCLIGQSLFSLIVNVNEINIELILIGADERELSWLPALIFPVLAVLVIAISIIFSMRFHKSPNKHKFTNETAKKYYNLIFTTMVTLRFLVLYTIFDIFYIQRLLILREEVNIISTQVICDIILIIIFIRFTNHRILVLLKEENNKKKERRIIEN